MQKLDRITNKNVDTIMTVKTDSSGRGRSKSVQPIKIKLNFYHLGALRIEGW